MTYNFSGASKKRSYWLTAKEMKLHFLLSLIFGFLCYALSQENQLQNGNFGTPGGLNAGAQRNGINPQYNPGYSGGLSSGNGERNLQLNGGRNGMSNPGLGGGLSPDNGGRNAMTTPGFGGGITPGNGGRNGMNSNGFIGGLNPGTGRRNGMTSPGFSGGLNPENGGRNGMTSPGFIGGLNPGNGGTNGMSSPGFSGALNSGNGVRNGMTSPGFGNSLIPGNGGRNEMNSPGFSGGFAPGNGGTKGIVNPSFSRDLSPGSGGRNGMFSPGFSGGLAPGNRGQGLPFGGGRGGMSGNTGNSQFPVGGNGINNPDFSRSGLTPGNTGQSLQFGGARSGIPGNTGNFQFPGGRNGMNNLNVGRTGSEGPQFGGSRGGMNGNAANFLFPGSSRGINNPNFQSAGSGSEGLQFGGGRGGISGDTGSFTNGNGINSGIGGKNFQFDGGRDGIPGNARNFQSLGGENGINNPGFGNGINHAMGGRGQFSGGRDRIPGNSDSFQSLAGGNGINNSGFVNGINSDMGGEYFPSGERRGGFPGNIRDFQSLGGRNGINSPSYGRNRLVPGSAGDDAQFNRERGGLPGNGGNFPFPVTGNAVDNPNFGKSGLTPGSGTESELSYGMSGNARQFQSLGGNRVSSLGLRNGMNSGNRGEGPLFDEGITGIPGNEESFQSLKDENKMNSINFGANGPTPQKVDEGIQLDEGRSEMTDSVGISRYEITDVSDGKQIKSEINPGESTSFVDSSLPDNAGLLSSEEFRKQSSEMSSVTNPDSATDVISSGTEKEDLSQLKELDEQGNRIYKLKNAGSDGKDSSDFEEGIPDVKTMSGKERDKIQSIARDDNSSDQCSNKDSDYDYGYDEYEFSADSGDAGSIKKLGKEEGEYKTLVVTNEERNPSVSETMLSNKRQVGHNVKILNDKRKAFKQKSLGLHGEEDGRKLEIQDGDVIPESSSANDFNKIGMLKGKDSESFTSIGKGSYGLSEIEDARSFSEEESGMDSSLKTISTTTPSKGIPEMNVEYFDTDSKNFKFGRRPSLPQNDKVGNIESLGKDYSKPNDENAALKRLSEDFDTESSEINNRGNVMDNKGKLFAQLLRELNTWREKGASIDDMALPNSKSFPRMFRGERNDEELRNRVRMFLQRQLNSDNKGRKNSFNYGSNSDDMESQGSAIGFSEDSTSFTVGSNRDMTSEGHKKLNDNNRNLYQLGPNRNIQYSDITNNPSGWLSGSSGYDLGGFNGRSVNLYQENSRSYDAGQMSDTALRGTGNDYGEWYRENSPIPSARGARVFGENFGKQVGNTFSLGLSGNGNTESMGTYRLDDRQIQAGGKRYGASTIKRDGIQMPFARELDISGKGVQEGDLLVERQGTDLGRNGRERLNRLGSSFSRIQDNGQGGKFDGKLRGALDEERGFLNDADGGDLDGKVQGSVDKQRAFIDDASGGVAERSLQTATNRKSSIAGRVSEAKDGARGKFQRAEELGRSTLNNASGGTGGKLLAQANGQRSNVGGTLEGAGRTGLDVAEKQRSNLDVTGGTEASKQLVETASGAGPSISSNAEGAVPQF